MLTAFKRQIIDIPEEYRPDIDELPGDLRRIATAIEEAIPGMGVRLTLILAQIFPGQHMYFRSAEEFLIAYRDEAIRTEYDQGNVTAKELATKTGLSLRHVEKILSGPPSQDELQERQMRLF